MQKNKKEERKRARTNLSNKLSINISEERMLMRTRPMILIIMMMLWFFLEHREKEKKTSKRETDICISASNRCI
jgi:hypothetical protein